MTEQNWYRISEEEIEDIIDRGGITATLWANIHSRPVDNVLDEAIEHYKKVINDGKGVVFNHPIDYQWMYGSVVKYLEDLRKR